MKDLLMCEYNIFPIYVLFRSASNPVPFMSGGRIFRVGNIVHMENKYSDGYNTFRKFEVHKYKQQHI